MVISFSRQTYLDDIAHEIKEVAADKDIADAFAAGRVIAEKFGYDLDEVEFVDGAGDRGIDFWYASDTGLYVYQIKTHDLTERGYLNLDPPFANDGVLDLMRARNFILSNEKIDDDHKLSSIKDTFMRVVRNHRSQETDSPVHVYLTLVILGNSLTEAAFEELASFEDTLASSAEYDRVPIQFHVDFQNIDDIMNAAWREENQDWVDIDGNRRETIRLTPMRQSNKLVV